MHTEFEAIGFSNHEKYDFILVGGGDTISCYSCTWIKQNGELQQGSDENCKKDLTQIDAGEISQMICPAGKKTCIVNGLFY